MIFLSLPCHAGRKKSYRQDGGRLEIVGERPVDQVSHVRFQFDFCGEFYRVFSTLFIASSEHFYGRWFFSLDRREVKFFSRMIDLQVVEFYSLPV